MSPRRQKGGSRKIGTGIQFCPIDFRLFSVMIESALSLGFDPMNLERLSSYCSIAVQSKGLQEGCIPNKICALKFGGLGIRAILTSLPTNIFDIHCIVN